MYGFRENWEINITICHSVPFFNLQWLFANSLRSTVLFQCHSENTWPTLMALWHGFHWFAKEMYIQLIPPRFEGLLHDWLIFILYLLQFACYSKYSAKTTNFLFLNLFLDFLHPLVRKHLRIFVTIMQSNFTAFQPKFTTKVNQKRILGVTSILKLPHLMSVMFGGWGLLILALTLWQNDIFLILM